VLEVNGKPHTLQVDTRTTLLDALREYLHLESRALRGRSS
jgi:xanthine dehydrogenase YagT iron-sulfur-binding subunit